MDWGNSSGTRPNKMGPGPGLRPPSVWGPVNRVARRRVIRYQKKPGEPYTLYSPFGWMSHRPCECRLTYGYPDEVVLAVDDERRRLGKAVDRLTRQLEEARGVTHGQAIHLRELEQSLRDEEERTDSFRRQLHDMHLHLLAMKRQLRERVRDVIADCEIVLDVVAEVPPRATGPEPMEDADTLDSVGDWAPGGGALGPPM